MTWKEGFSSRLQRKLEVRLTALGTWKEPRWTSRKDDGNEKLTGMGVGKGSRPRVSTLPLRCL